MGDNFYRVFEGQISTNNYYLLMMGQSPNYFIFSNPILKAGVRSETVYLGFSPELEHHCDK